MLAFSEKLTATPWEMKEVDVAGLRNHGLVTSTSFDFAQDR